MKNLREIPRIKILKKVKKNKLCLKGLRFILSSNKRGRIGVVKRKNIGFYNKTQDSKIFLGFNFKTLGLLLNQGVYLNKTFLKYIGLWATALKPTFYMNYKRKIPSFNSKYLKR